jgi:hypothetical protein
MLEVEEVALTLALLVLGVQAVVEMERQLDQLPVMDLQILAVEEEVVVEVVLTAHLLAKAQAALE